MSATRTAPPDMTGWAPETRRYAQRLLAIIERDRTEAARGVRAIVDAIREHEWLTLGRGSYEFDDDRWRDEFGAAIEAIQMAIEPLRAVAGNLNDSPQSAEDVAAPRALLPAPIVHRSVAEKHDHRVTELLEANNREVERRRVAEAALERVSAVLGTFIADSTDPGTEALAAAWEASQVLRDA